MTTTDNEPEPAAPTHLEQIAPISDALFQAARVHRIAARDLLKDTGLYPGQEILMLKLWEYGPTEQSELISSLGLDPSTVTRMVQRLEKSGMVRRSRSARDGRAVVVEATEGSMTVRERVLEAWRELEALTCRLMSAHDSEYLQSLLESARSGLTLTDGHSPMA